MRRLEPTSTRILVCARALVCKKYNLGAKITRKLGTSSFSLFPLNIRRSKYLAQWSLECSVT
jgi:hypothetical protein